MHVVPSCPALSDRRRPAAGTSPLATDFPVPGRCFGRSHKDRRPVQGRDRRLRRHGAQARPGHQAMSAARRCSCLRRSAPRSSYDGPADQQMREQDNPARGLCPARPGILPLVPHQAPRTARPRRLRRPRRPRGQRSPSTAAATTRSREGCGSAASRGSMRPASEPGRRQQTRPLPPAPHRSAQPAWHGQAAGCRRYGGPADGRFAPKAPGALAPAHSTPKLLDTEPARA